MCGRLAAVEVCVSPDHGYIQRVVQDLTVVELRGRHLMIAQKASRRGRGLVGCV